MKAMLVDRACSSAISVTSFFSSEGSRSVNVVSFAIFKHYIVAPIATTNDIAKQCKTMRCNYDITLREVTFNG